MALRRANRFARRAELPQAVDVAPTGAATGSGSPVTIGQALVASWTSSGGRWYYDLVHGKGREGVWLTFYDSVSNKLDGFVIDELQPLPGSETSTLRIWIDYNPGANRIRIYYL